MKMVFITASPVLTNEVKRFYSSIKAKLVVHLRKREAEREKRILQEEFQNITEEEANRIIDEAIKDENGVQVQDEVAEAERKEMLDFIKKEEKDLMEDL